jgi:hypothetical protein
VRIIPIALRTKITHIPKQIHKSAIKSRIGEKPGWTFSFPSISDQKKKIAAKRHDQANPWNLTFNIIKAMLLHHMILSFVMLK